jgi:hypothetical protein
MVACKTLNYIYIYIFIFIVARVLVVEYNCTPVLQNTDIDVEQTWDFGRRPRCRPIQQDGALQYNPDNPSQVL